MKRSGDDAAGTLLVGRRGVAWDEPFWEVLDRAGVPVTDRLFDLFDAGEDIVLACCDLQFVLKVGDKESIAV